MKVFASCLKMTPVPISVNSRFFEAVTYAEGRKEEPEKKGREREREKSANEKEERIRSVLPFLLN